MNSTTTAPSILLVDDDQALLQALPRLVALRIQGVKVDTSDTALRGLELLRVHDYDAIISDIKMPGMDGLQLLAEIREVRPETPTLLITGHVDQAMTLEALRLGAYDFIPKPVDRVYLIAALQRAIQTHQLRRQVQEQQRTLADYAQTLEQTVERRTHDLRVANKKMEGLVHDLLASSLIATHRFSLQLQSCDIVALCVQVIEDYASITGLMPRFESSVSSLEIEADHDRLGQALTHLLANAFAYSPADTAVTVSLRLLEETQEAQVVVRDHGLGIAEEELPQIFEQFHQGSAEALREARPRFGVGLYLVSQIVERHGGRIEVKSIPGLGSTFTLSLPLTSSTAQPVEASAEAEGFEPPDWLVS